MEKYVNKLEIFYLFSLVHCLQMYTCVVFIMIGGYVYCGIVNDIHTGNFMAAIRVGATVAHNLNAKFSTV